MKLTHIRIKDFRSFSGEHDFDVSSGVNYFVGPNNCGKSNLIRAIELALDPDATYVPEVDRPARSPGVGAPPTTRITLTFQVGSTAPEKTLLRRAKDYELMVRRGRGAAMRGRKLTYAEDSEIRMVTSFAGQGRQTTFQAKGSGAASLPSESPEHVKLESQFRGVLRLAVVHSGEDLESLLKGKFRQILQPELQQKPRRGDIGVGRTWLGAARTASDQQQHEKDMLKRYRQHYKDLDAESKRKPEAMTKAIVFLRS